MGQKYTFFINEPEFCDCCHNYYHNVNSCNYVKLIKDQLRSSKKNIRDFTNVDELEYYIYIRRGLLLTLYSFDKKAKEEYDHLSKILNKLIRNKFLKWGF